MLAVLCLGCGRAKLTPEAEAKAHSITLTFDRRSVEGCGLINRFEGKVFSGKNIEGARAELKRVAWSHGADTVLVLGEFDSKGSISRGEGYACAGRPVPASTPSNAGCSNDTDCKGDRICAKGACVDPGVAPAD